MGFGSDDLRGLPELGRKNSATRGNSGLCLGINGMLRGIYGTAGIVLFDQQYRPGTRMFLRLGFTSSFEPIIEFNGNNLINSPHEMLVGCFRLLDSDTFTYYSSGTANGLIEKEEVLSDTSWMKDYKSQGDTLFGIVPGIHQYKFEQLRNSFLRPISPLRRYRSMV